MSWLKTSSLRSVINTSLLAAGCFITPMDLSSLDGSNGFRLDGVSALDFSLGTSAGDVNGDGFDDLIVSASGADPNGESSGSTYVVFGKAVGFAATTDLSSLNGNFVPMAV